jgi:hypothetical protein
MFVKRDNLFPKKSSEPDFAKYRIIGGKIYKIYVLPGQDGTDTDLHEVVELTQEELNDLQTNTSPQTPCRW